MYKNSYICTVFYIKKRSVHRFLSQHKDENEKWIYHQQGLQLLYNGFDTDSNRLTADRDDRCHHCRAVHFARGTLSRKCSHTANYGGKCHVSALRHGCQRKACPTDWQAGHQQYQESVYVNCMECDVCGYSHHGCHPDVC